MTPATSSVGSAAPASPAERLAIEQELFADPLLPAQLSPIDRPPLERTVSITGSLRTVAHDQPPAVTEVIA